MRIVIYYIYDVVTGYLIVLLLIGVTSMFCSEISGGEGIGKALLAI